MPARTSRYSWVISHSIKFWVALMIVLGAGQAHAQSGVGVLTGTVTDAQEHKPVGDVVVTVTSPALQGEQVVVTDNSGFYRIPNLPAGEGYTIRLEKEGYKPYAREGISLRAEATLRANADLLPDSVKAEEVVVVAQAPTVDVGSSSTGATINKDFTRRVPLAAPGGKGSASRSFEAVAAATPGASEDRMGVSISGASSPENAYVIDGLSVNNPGIGTIGSPLSSEFVDEVNVISAGYLPEFGRSTGGTISATTKSGSDEFHGGVFGYFSPGALEGTRKSIRQDLGSVAFDTKLNHVADIGADIGGPIIKKKLWFYVGVDLSHESYAYSRYFRALNPSGGYSKIDGTDASWDAVATQFQGIGKLTWAINEDNKVTLSANMTPTSSGGRNQFAVDPIRGGAEIVSECSSGSTCYGQHDAIAHKLLGSAYDTSLKWSTAFDNKRVLVDTQVGWHHEKDGTLPSDGTLPGSGQGLSALNNITWNANSPFHSLTNFESSAALKNACGADGSLCPVTSYVTGGPGDIDVQIFNRYVASSTLTYLFQSEGHHVVKAGAQFELVTYDHLTGHSGGAREAEPAGGGTLDVAEGWGQLTGPDQPKVLDPLHINSKSINVGGFVQDSWSILDKVTLNAGIRYDVQQLYGGNGNIGLSLPNQWAPRIGVIWDPTQEGHAKVFGNYARYYQNAPLALNDLTLTGQPVLGASYDQAQCNIVNGIARCPASAAVPGNSGSSISQKYFTYGNGSSPIDPNIKATSSDEVVFGGEYELLKDARFGLTYTKRWLNHWVEDFSFDGLNTYQLGNPGYGIGSALPKAQRNYDAVTLFFQKAWRDDWLAQASYTVSYLRGNVGGFIAQDGTIGPSHNSDFDSRYFTNNQYGPLPSDHTHDIKLFGAKDWTLAPHHSISTGASVRAQSGGPINFYASDQVYTQSLNLLLPRGSGGRLPWEYNADMNVAYHYNIDKNQTLTFSVDVFNIFNFQAANAVDENYTPAYALGRPGGNLRQARTQDTGRPLYASDVNPNFKNPTSYQAPRSFRFGIRSTF